MSLLIGDFRLLGQEHFVNSLLALQSFLKHDFLEKMLFLALLLNQIISIFPLEFIQLLFLFIKLIQQSSSFLQARIISSLFSNQLPLILHVLVVDSALGYTSFVQLPKVVLVELVALSFVVPCDFNSFVFNLSSFVDVLL